MLLLFMLPVLFLLLNLYCLLLAPAVIFYPYALYLLYTLCFLSAFRYGSYPFRSSFVRRLSMFRHFAAYFPVRLHPPAAPLPASASYILGYHPHGIISVGAISAFATDCCEFPSLFPGLSASLLTLESSFRLPFWSLLMMGCGVCGSSRESIDWLLQRRGSLVVLVLGGAGESLDAFEPAALPEPAQFTTPAPSPAPSPTAAAAAARVSSPHCSPASALSRSPSLSSGSCSPSTPAYPILLHLNHRRGFLRLALQHGSHLIPCFAFGELSLFSQAANPRGSWLRSCQERVRRVIGFATPLFRGRGVFNYRFGVLPHRSPVDVRCGELITVQKAEGDAGVTEEQIDALQARYKQGLIDLFEQYKGLYASTQDAQLVFV